jgi:hypothetical protein
MGFLKHCSKARSCYFDKQSFDNMKLAGLIITGRFMKTSVLTSKTKKCSCCFSVKETIILQPSTGKEKWKI